MCGCHGRCCKCLTAVLLEWSGDRDFAGDLDVRTYPGYFAKLIDEQPQGTQAFWRIRYNPDQEFLEYLTDTRSLVAGSALDGTAFINYMPFSNETAIISGPLRDGIMYGLDMVPAGRYVDNTYRRPTFLQPDPYTAAVDASFIGEANLKSYNTNGQPESPLSWTIQDHPDNPIEIPWVLEIGCARCRCLDSVTWPKHQNWHYDPWVPHGGVGGGLTATNPDESTLISSTVNGCCQVITADDLQSAYWPGDEAEPDHAAVCPPDCIVWVSDIWSIQPNVFWSTGGARSMPGASFPSDAARHPATTLAASLGDTIQLDGWTGQHINADVARAARGDSADIANVSCIWLANVWNIYLSESEKTFSFNFASSDAQWIVDWLALGNKTLIVDTPWKHVPGPYPLPSGSYDAASFGSAFLSAIGSSLSLYDITTPTRIVEDLTCVSTELHSLAPDPETLFSMVRDTPMLTLGGGVMLGPMGITGGTAVYRIDCTISENSGQIAESHNCVAVDEQGNGSRIIVGSLAFDNQVYAESNTGLANMPGIANMIGRIII